MTITCSGRRALLALAASVCTLGMSGGSAAAASSDPPFGAAHPAKGSPVTFAMINAEGGFQISYPELRVGAQTAIAYLNKYKNGLNGHPIKLVACATDGSAAGSSACATQLLDQHPIAFLGGIDLGTTGSIPLIQQANLAFIGGDPLGSPELTSPVSVQFNGGGPAAFIGQVSYALQGLHVKSAAVIYADNFVGRLITNAFIVPPLRAAGVSVKTVAQDPNTTIWTPAFAAVGNPDVIFTQSSADNCIPMMQAHQQIVPNVPVFWVGCNDPKLLKSAGSAAEGTLTSSSFLQTTEKSPDVTLYNKLVKYLMPKNTAQDVTTITGVATVINLWRALHTLSVSELNTTQILSAFKSGSNHPNFMSRPYTCDGKQLQGGPAVCDPAVRIYKIHNANMVAASPRWWNIP
jgi:branched-chain amino acid transport system substrate-binding protein